MIHDRDELRRLEAELEAERWETEQQLKRERFGAPCEPFVHTRCLNCGGTLIPNSAGFLVHQGHPSCSRPTVSIEEARRG